MKTIVYWRDLKPKFDSDGHPENEAARAFGMRPAELARTYCGHASVWGSIQSGQPAGGEYSYAIRAINSGHCQFVDHDGRHHHTGLRRLDLGSTRRQKDQEGSLWCGLAHAQQKIVQTLRGAIVNPIFQEAHIKKTLEQDLRALENGVCKNSE
ncbi:hypothetical protein [Treponema endosymbiont of Eucomonympha sp.]|uniref:hypothetical protein n=1 Tax=Treponema endosymbiont of Eucomonympha sp. TaxID=1580831 RepID=UPI0007846B3E|nr:hypothetical protein [Treponema endosymbiont of Eucomonympha sp.]